MILLALSFLVVAEVPDGPTLRKLMQSEDADVRMGVFEQLELEALTGNLRLPRESLLELVPALEDRDAAVRKAARVFWQGIGSGALPGLLAAMEHEDVNRRRIGAATVPLIHARLNRQEATRAIQQLERLLFDAEAPPRRAAEESLRQLKALP